MTTSISGMRILPSGDLVPAYFDPSKIGEYESKASNCQRLKTELSLELKRSSFIGVKALFKERGTEFIIEMFDVDPWENASNKGRSILEKVLSEMRFDLPEETLVYLFSYFIDNSEQAKTAKMNFLHVLARNCSSDKVVSILKTAVVHDLPLLRDRMSLGEGLDMTPVEMVIRTSFNESLMIYMLSKYQESVGSLTLEDKDKLLSHAEWLSGSGIYSTSRMGVRLMERIIAIPAVPS